VVADGAPGLMKAVEELWSEADRQRCTTHRLRNITAKLPQQPELQERVKAAYWSALDNATSAADAESRLRRLVGELERDYPSAAACLAEDLPALCVHLDYPLRLRIRLRSTNLLERSLEEVKRRTKVIGRFPGETSCLSLCRAVMDLFIAGARGLGLTDLDREQLRQLRAQRTHQEVVEKSAWGRLLKCVNHCEAASSLFQQSRDAALAPPVLTQVGPTPEIGRSVTGPGSVGDWVVSGLIDTGRATRDEVFLSTGCGRSPKIRSRALDG
jgi:hypothetical protein